MSEMPLSSKYSCYIKLRKLQSQMEASPSSLAKNDSGFLQRHVEIKLTSNFLQKNKKIGCHDFNYISVYKMSTLCLHKGFTTNFKKNENPPRIIYITAAAQRCNCFKTNGTTN